MDSKRTPLKEEVDTDVTELWDADPNCDHEIRSAQGGGEECSKCSGWFCY
jgi:hypothetical protein